MAYTSILASVSEEQIWGFRQDKDAAISASHIIRISHLIAYWVQVQPLGQLLAEAIDGGEVLHSNIRYPFRSPTFHVARLVPTLHNRLNEAHDAALAELNVPDDEWYEAQIRQVLELFVWAANRGEAIVSLLEPYSDILILVQSPK